MFLNLFYKFLQIYQIHCNRTGEKQIQHLFRAVVIVGGLFCECAMLGNLPENGTRFVFLQ